MKIIFIIALESCFGKFYGNCLINRWTGRSRPADGTCLEDALEVKLHRKLDDARPVDGREDGGIAG